MLLRYLRATGIVLGGYGCVIVFGFLLVQLPEWAMWSCVGAFALFVIHDIARSL